MNMGPQELIGLFGILAVAFIAFCIYFFFKQLEFVLVSVNLYRKMVRRQDAMLKLLIDIRDNTKSYTGPSSEDDPDSRPSAL